MPQGHLLSKGARLSAPFSSLQGEDSNKVGSHSGYSLNGQRMFQEAHSQWPVASSNQVRPLRQVDKGIYISSTQVSPVPWSSLFRGSVTPRHNARSGILRLTCGTGTFTPPPTLVWASHGGRHPKPKQRSVGAQGTAAPAAVVLGMARPQTMHCWAGPGAQGSAQTTRGGTSLPCPCWQCKVGPQR